MSMKEELAVAEKKIFDFTQQSSELKEKISALEVYWEMHVKD